MKIKNILPAIITDHVASTAAEFEKFGFIQKHHLVEDNKLEIFVMEAEDGAKIELLNPAEEDAKIRCGFIAIVDDIDEAIAYFSENGFKIISDKFTAKKTHICRMLWEATGTMVAVMQHIKD